MSWRILTQDDVHDLTPPERVIEVGLDGFGISKSEGLVTQDVSVCTGVALLPRSGDGPCALLHLYANPSLFVQGEHAIARYARHMWHKFSENLDDKTKYDAVIFGGQDGLMPVHGVSRILSDTIHESVTNSGFVENTQDMRFSSKRSMQAVINPATKEFAVGDDFHFYGMDALEDAPRQSGSTLGAKSFRFEHKL